MMGLLDDNNNYDDGIRLRDYNEKRHGIIFCFIFTLCVSFVL